MLQWRRIATLVIVQGVYEGTAPGTSPRLRLHTACRNEKERETQAFNERIGRVPRLRALRRRRHCGCGGHACFEVSSETRRPHSRGTARLCSPPRGAAPARWTVARELTRVIGNMSEAGLLHLDLKPMNIVYRSKPALEFKIIDYDPFFAKLCTRLPVQVLTLLNSVLFFSNLRGHFRMKVVRFRSKAPQQAHRWAEIEALFALCCVRRKEAVWVSSRRKRFVAMRRFVTTRGHTCQHASSKSKTCQMYQNRTQKQSHLTLVLRDELHAQSTDYPHHT